MKSILNRYIVFSCIFLSFFFLLGYHVTHSYFSNASLSTSNTFAAASVFPTPTVLITPTPAGIANHIVISEVQITGGSGATTNDFVELYNPTSSQIDLNGIRLVKRTGGSTNDTTIKSWTSQTLIQPHGFYLWANADNGFAASLSADASTSASLASDNSIALRLGAENNGTIIDALSWDSAVMSLKEGTEFSPDPGTNQSMERKAYQSSNTSTMAVSGPDELKGNGYDANDNATDFVLRSVSQPQNSHSSIEIP